MANSSTPVVVLITDAESWVINIGFYMIGGVIGATTNLLVLTTILLDKNLRSSSFFIELSFVAMTRCLSTIQNIVLSSYRLLKALGLASPILGRWQCYSLYIALIHYGQVDLTFLLFISFDRMVAVAKPMFYKSITPKRVALLSAMLYVIIVTCVHVPEFFGSMPAYIDCVNVLSPKLPGLINMDNIVTLILSILIVASYAILASFVFFKYFKGTHNTQVNASMKKHMDIFRPLLLVVVSTSIGTIAPRFLFFFAALSPTASVRLVAYAGMLTCIDFVVMCFALLAKSTDFRVAFKKRFTSAGVTWVSRVNPTDQRI